MPLHCARCAPTFESGHGLASLLLRVRMSPMSFRLPYNCLGGSAPSRRGVIHLSEFVRINRRWSQAVILEDASVYDFGERFRPLKCTGSSASRGFEGGGSSLRRFRPW